MNYSDPKLRSILAGEYVLGTMPMRTRARFERLMRFDAGLACLVGDWAERLGTIDATAPAAAPPSRVWTAIEARTMTAAAKSTGFSFPFWRGLALGSAAVAAALLVFVGMRTNPPPTMPTLVAVVADKDNQPCWVVTEDKGGTTLSVAAVWSPAADPQHDFELWAVADNKPVPIGVISAVRDKVVTFPAKSLPTNGAILAVSIEPPGGSPAELPTGPVLFQGKILTN